MCALSKFNNNDDNNNNNIIIIVIIIIIIINKREFKDAVHLRYDWQVNDVPIVCICGELFNVDHAMICNKAPDARLDIHARGFWSRQDSTFFDVRVCHPNAESYKDLTPQQIYRQHENKKKRMYASRVMEVEQATSRR